MENGRRPAHIVLSGKIRDIGRHAVAEMRLVHRVPARVVRRVAEPVPDRRAVQHVFGPVRHRKRDLHREVGVQIVHRALQLLIVAGDRRPNVCVRQRVGADLGLAAADRLLHDGEKLVLIERIAIRLGNDLRLAAVVDLHCRVRRRGDVFGLTLRQRREGRREFVCVIAVRHVRRRLRRLPEKAPEPRIRLLDGKQPADGAVAHIAIAHRIRGQCLRLLIGEMQRQLIGAGFLRQVPLDLLGGLIADVDAVDNGAGNEFGCVLLRADGVGAGCCSEKDRHQKQHSSAARLPLLTGFHINLCEMTIAKMTEVVIIVSFSN